PGGTVPMVRVHKSRHLAARPVTALSCAWRRPVVPARDSRKPHWSTIAACGWGFHRRRTSRSPSLGSNRHGSRQWSLERQSTTTGQARVVLEDRLLSIRAYRYFHALRVAAAAAESQAFG